MSNIQLKRISCISCGALIAKGEMMEGAIEIRCKCGVDNRIEARQKPESRMKDVIDVLGVELGSRVLANRIR